MKKSKMLIASGLVFLGLLSSCDLINDKPDTNEVVTPIEVSLVGLNSEYGVGSVIDLTSLSVKVKYSNDTYQTYSLFDDQVKYDDFDTDTVGVHNVKISFNDLEIVVVYNVNVINLHLDFNGGSYNDKDSLEVECVKNVANIKDIVPVSGEDGYKFAGWFYDKELTNRVDFLIDGELTISNDTTIYAGYDVDYTDVFDYEVIDSYVKLIKYKGNSNTIVIPSTIDLYPVTIIGREFAYNDLGFGYSWDSDWGVDVTTLSFEENSNVKIIEDRAFYTVPLLDVSLPDSLESVGKYAFYFTHMENLVLPKNLKNIEEYAFAFNCDLVNIDFNDSEVISIGIGAFSDCMALTNVTLSNKIEIIASEAFAGCLELKEFNIPNSVETLGLNVLSGLPNLKRINVDENNTKFKSVDGNLLSKDGTIFYRYCYGNFNEEYDMPSTVKLIYEGAFNVRLENVALKTLNLNDGLEQIGDLAFENTSVSFTIPSSVSVIGQKAFYGWTGSEFKIDPNNKFYSVVNKSLVSYDKKTLIAIPDGYDDPIYVLDDNVVSIDSYVCKSLNVSSFVINENSKLETILPYALQLSNWRNLDYVYISKEIPFLITNFSFFNDGFVYNDNYYIVCDNYDAYSNSWKDVHISNDSSYPIDDYLITSLNYLNLTIDSFDDNLNISSFEAFNRFNSYLTLINYPKKFADLIVTMKKAISLLSLFDDIPSVQYNYIKEFLVNFMNIGLDFYKDLTDYDLVYNGYNFSKLYDCYLTCPDDIKNVIDADLMNSLNDKYNFVMNENKLITSDIYNFNYNPLFFDYDKYNDIIDRCNKYNYNGIIKTNNEDVALYRLVLQHYLYLFDTLEYNQENYPELYRIYYGDASKTDIFSTGIEFYLNIYLTNEEENSVLYGYDRLYDNLAKLDNLSIEVAKYVNEAFKNFKDSIDYYDGMYDELFKLYDSIDNKYLLDDETIILYNSYQMRCIYNKFLSLSRNGDDFYNIDTYTDDVLTQLSYISNDMNQIYNYDNDYLINLKEYDDVVTSINNYNKMIDLANSFFFVLIDNYYEFSLENFDHDKTLAFYHKFSSFVESIGYYRYFEAVVIADNISDLSNVELVENNYEEIFNLVVGYINQFILEYVNLYDVMNIINTVAGDDNINHYNDIANML